MRLFDPDSRFMEALSTISDLLILNLVTAVCCLPVITIGAAMTGMHYVLLKMVRKEEGYIVRSYFKSFKENFRQAVLMWILFLMFLGIFLLDLHLTGNSGDSQLQLPFVLRALLVAGGGYIFLMYLYAFPLLSRFHNTVAGTISNSAKITAACFPRSLAMAAVTILFPVLVFLFTPLLPLVLLFGLTGPGYLCALIYNSIFKKLEGDAAGDTSEFSDSAPDLSEASPGHKDQNQH